MQASKMLAENEILVPVSQKNLYVILLLSCVSVAIDTSPTQLNSTSSCRRVHSVNNCHLSMNVVTQLTQFVGHDVINKNTTDLAVRCSTGSVEFSSVELSRVELCRYKHPFSQKNLYLILL